MPFVDSFINATVTPFFYLFSEKGKDKLYDKSTVLHVRRQKFLYQVLASQDEGESRRGNPAGVEYEKWRISKRRIYIVSEGNLFVLEVA